MRNPPNTPWLILACLCVALTSLVLKSTVTRSGLAIPQVQPKASLAPLDRETLVIHYHERRPYYRTVREGVAGFIGQPVAEALKLSGLAFQWQLTPAKRQLEIIKNNSFKCCAVGWFKTEERLGYSRYSDPIYRDMPFVALAKSGNSFFHDYETVDAVLARRDVRLLVKEGYSYGAFIDGKLEQLSPAVVATTGDNETMLSMIVSNRADYCFLAEDEAFDLLFSPKVRRADFQLIHFTDMPEGNYRYLICTKKVREEEMQRLNDALQHVIGLEEER